MTILETIQQEDQKFTVIPLGLSKNGKFIYMRPPIFKGRHSSNTIIIAGMSGTGKSVIKRLLISYMSLLRPVYVFDWAGRDHYKGYKKNKAPKNLPKGASARGVNGWYFYYPVQGARQREKYEIVVRPDFTKYGYRQLVNLGFSGAAPANLKNLINTQGPFTDIHHLSKTVADTRSIQRISKEVITRDLNLHILSKNIFRTDSRKDLDIEKAVLSGQNLIFSFNDLNLARAEIDFFLKKLIQIVDSNKGMIPPFVFVEEAHDIFNDDLLSYFVLVCRKLGIGLCMTMPTLETLPSKVASDVKEWILGKLKGKSASLVNEYVAEGISPTIRNLRLNRFTQEREFCYYSTDEEREYVFEAFECPQEYERIV